MKHHYKNVSDYTVITQSSAGLIIIIIKCSTPKVAESDGLGHKGEWSITLGKPVPMATANQNEWAFHFQRSFFNLLPIISRSLGVPENFRHNLQSHVISSHVIYAFF